MLTCINNLKELGRVTYLIIKLEIALTCKLHYYWRFGILGTKIK